MMASITWAIDDARSSFGCRYSKYFSSLLFGGESCIFPLVMRSPGDQLTRAPTNLEQSHAIWIDKLEAIGSAVSYYQ